MNDRAVCASCGSLLASVGGACPVCTMPTEVPSGDVLDPSSASATGSASQAIDLVSRQLPASHLVLLGINIALVLICLLVTAGLWLFPSRPVSPATPALPTQTPLDFSPDAPLDGTQPTMAVSTPGAKQATPTHTPRPSHDVQPTPTTDSSGTGVPPTATSEPAPIPTTPAALPTATPTQSPEG